MAGNERPKLVYRLPTTPTNCPKWSTTLLQQWGFRQCLPFLALDNTRKQDRNSQLLAGKASTVAATSVKFRQGSDFGALPAVAALRGKHCWGPISFMEVVGLLGHCLFMTPIYTFFDIQGVQLKVEWLAVNITRVDRMMFWDYYWRNSVYLWRAPWWARATNNVKKPQSQMCESYTKLNCTK